LLSSSSWFETVSHQLHSSGLWDMDIVTCSRNNIMDRMGLFVLLSWRNDLTFPPFVVTLMDPAALLPTREVTMVEISAFHVAVMQRMSPFFDDAQCSMWLDEWANNNVAHSLFRRQKLGDYYCTLILFGNAIQ
jgi:hypothetical protein